MSIENCLTEGFITLLLTHTCIGQVCYRVLIMDHLGDTVFCSMYFDQEGPNAFAIYIRTYLHHIRSIILYSNNLFYVHTYLRHNHHMYRPKVPHLSIENSLTEGFITLFLTHPCSGQVDYLVSLDYGPPQR